VSPSELLKMLNNCSDRVQGLQREIILLTRELENQGAECFPLPVDSLQRECKPRWFSHLTLLSAISVGVLVYRFFRGNPVAT